jgi:acyl-coenzyme A synthetase/AMP-(fatty) acid ligase
MAVLQFKMIHWMILNLDKQSSGTFAAIDSSGNTLTYGELLSVSEEIKQYMPSRSIFFLLSANNIGGIAWSIGSINAGIIPLLLNAHIDEKLYRQLYVIYQPLYICIPKTFVPQYNTGKQIIDKYGYVLLETDNIQYPVYEELSHLLSTSGSTGSPKLVRHSYGNIEAAGLNISTFFKLTRNDRPLLVLPLYYTMGLSVVFSHLYVGATILITDLSMTDKKFWEFVSVRKATSFTGVPYSFEVLRMVGFLKMELPHLELLTQGGGKMPRKLNLQFAEFARDTGKRWIATYGQTEGTARMAYLEAEYAISKCGSIGRAVPNAELFLIDKEGNIVDTPNTEGEMCYRGKNVTLGYAQKKEDLILGDIRKRIIWTGDLAYRDEDGFYFIIGRKGRFLKLYGMRIGLDECEQIIKAKFPIECACVGTDERMIVYITNSHYVRQVKEELVEKIKIVASAFMVEVVNSIPKNEAGKILYSKLNNVI